MRPRSHRRDPLRLGRRVVRPHFRFWTVQNTLLPNATGNATGQVIPDLWPCRDSHGVHQCPRGARDCKQTSFETSQARPVREEEPC